MVDHRADSDTGFDVFAGGGRIALWRDRLRDWLGGLAPRMTEPGRTAPLTNRAEASSALRAYRIPILLSAIWVGLMLAYSAGYLGLGTGPAVAPAAGLQLIIFATALVGPLGMLWFATLMLRRAERLSAAITGQSETALALAATVSNLQDSVDDLGDRAALRLERSLRSIEVRMSESVGALDESLTRAMDETRTAIADRGTALDRLLDETNNRADTQIGDRIAGLDRYLEAGAQKLDDLSTRQHDLIATRLEESARSVETALGKSADTLSTRLLDADRKVAEGVEQRADRLEETIRTAHEGQAARLTEASEKLELAVTTLSERLTTTLTARAEAFDTALAAESERLGEALRASTELVDGDVRRLLGDVRRGLEETRASITAHPPATAAELGRMLGDAAHGMIAPERAALAESVERMAGLEAAALGLAVRLDRTARLGAVTEGAPSAPVSSAAAPSLPLDTAPDAPLDTIPWSSVAVALDLADPHAEEAVAAARRAVMGERSIATLLTHAAVVTEGMVSEGIHPEDLTAVPATPALWCAYGKGTRGGAVDALAGIDDPAALRIVRARLRRDPDFRQHALAFVTGFGAMMTRAADETGAHPALLELADSRSGRAWQVLALLTGALDPIPGTGADRTA